MRTLFWKLALIIIVVVMAIWAVYPPAEKIRLGSDLRGGVSLIYHVDIPQGGNASEILSQTIQVLQDRVNPTGVFDIRFQPQGRDRIEIVMPLPSDKVIEAKQEFEDALTELERKAQIDPFELDQLLAQGSAGQRWGGAGEQSERLVELQSLYNQMRDARAAYEAIQQNENADPADVTRIESELARVEIAFDDLRAEILRRSLNRGEILRALRQSTNREKELDPAGKDVIDPATGKPKYLPSPRDIALEQLRANYPHVSDQINEVVREYDEYASIRTGLDDPDDLKRLLRGAGVLQFHVAVQATEPGFNFQQLREQLQERGPRNIDAPNVSWFPIQSVKAWADSPQRLAQLQADPISYFRNYAGEGFVAAEYQGEYYLLLYTSEDKSITHDRGIDWSVQRTNRAQDSLGRPAVSFTLDATGGQLMRGMTSRNVDRPMAIVLDGQVYSAPNINEAIGSNGIIQGSFSPDDIDYLMRVLAAGSLGARLSPEPIAQNVMGPTLGRDNLEKGLYACLIGVIVVAGVMATYYFTAGLIACIALLINGILIFGIMALQQATFTLPGIAGIVLTIGMAVDANVLIYERIREELFTGEVDLRTAVRLGFQKAFSTIFDGNVTNLIVCFVLYQTATTEVKGFALTLSIGILSTLFCALFITRVMFFIYTDVLKRESLAMLPSTFPSVHRALEPNINWVGLRRAFLPVSVVLLVVGSIAVLSRGVEMFDTEFRGGTAVTFTTKVNPDTGERMLLTRQEVEQSVREIAQNADNPILKQFETASVVTLGEFYEDFKAETFQIKVALPPNFEETADSNATITDTVVEAVVEKFQHVLSQSQNVAFAGLGLNENPNATFPITDGILGQVIDRPGFEQRVTASIGGVAVVIDDLDPPISTEDLRNRIERLRQQPDFSAYAGRQMQLFGLTPAAEPGTFSSMAVVIRDPAINYFDSIDTWERELAATEWRIVSEALQSASPLDQVSSFSASVAQTLFASAVVAVILSFFGILVYIWIRFGSLRYSLGAVIALIHDVIIALGLLALTHYVGGIAIFNAIGVDEFRIDMGVVAALLTLIGYSLNDTIVILDRIRENRGKRIITTAEVVNRSINQTFSRTVMTSGTTLLAVIIMFIEGGTGIRPFAFCLLMGLLVGTYSSVAIAAPLVYDKDAGGKGEGSPSTAEPETPLVPATT